MRYFYLQLILVSITTGTCYGQRFKDASINESIEKIASTLVGYTRINAVSIGILKDQSTYSFHFGELDKGKNNVPTNETIYPIASVTKTMTGYLGAMAVLEGKMKLDDDIRKYLKGRYPNLTYQDKPIKIKHLLTHTSRLPAEIVGLESFLEKGDMEGALAYVKSYSKDQFFDDLKSIALDTIPGTRYLYSSNGTNLLGYILEDIYKTSYEDLLEIHIFKKAGMKNTKLKLDKDQKEKLSNGYDGRGNITPAQPRFLLGADGYLKSTIADLAQYMRFQLDEENTIAQESRKKVNERMAPMGYFWQIENTGILSFYKHAGTAIGTTTWLIICPEKGIGISVIINSRFPDSNDLVYDATMKMLAALQR